MTLEKDTYQHKGLRKKLIDLLREKGISDERILIAMQKVPRHLFFDSAFMNRAYEDKAFPIGEGQTISQPYTVAYQSQLLAIKPGEKILEIGTGSGYQAAILLEMGAKVFTIERQRKLYDRTKTLLQELGYTSIKTYYGDGFEGLPTYAPFDKIIITAGASEVPVKLIDQLKINGGMIIPYGDQVQKMKRITKKPEGLQVEDFDDFTFVPMLHGKVQQ
jgi:protein-L-isoaspartate(D-aspartate) O-methyltransferase